MTRSGVCLRRACNPESAAADCSLTAVPQTGDDVYSYDANGNLATHTDARGLVTTISGFDALNRPGLVSYSGGTTPAKSYSYDADYKGALSSSTVTSGTLV